MMAEELKSTGKINLTHWIEIEDEQGEMTVVPFDDAVNVLRAAPASERPFLPLRHVPRG